MSTPYFNADTSTPNDAPLEYRPPAPTQISSNVASDRLQKNYDRMIAEPPLRENQAAQKDGPS